METLEAFIDQVTVVLQKIYGLPAFALVLIGCIVLGYILRLIKQFPNDGIPLAVVLCGAVLFPMIADANSVLPLRIWLVRNFVMGLIIGFLAWALHNKFLSKIEGRIGLADDSKMKNESNHENKSDGLPG